MNNLITLIVGNDEWDAKVHELCTCFRGSQGDRRLTHLQMVCTMRVTAEHVSAGRSFAARTSLLTGTNHLSQIRGGINEHKSASQQTRELIKCQSGIALCCRASHGVKKIFAFHALLLSRKFLRRVECRYRVSCVLTREIVDGNKAVVRKIQ